MDMFSDPPKSPAIADGNLFGMIEGYQVIARTRQPSNPGGIKSQGH
jgi:hypothetical protein